MGSNHYVLRRKNDTPFVHQFFAYFLFWYVHQLLAYFLFWPTPTNIHLTCSLIHPFISIIYPYWIHPMWEINIGQHAKLAIDGASQGQLCWSCLCIICINIGLDLSRRNLFDAWNEERTLFGFKTRFGINEFWARGGIHGQHKFFISFFSKPRGTTHIWIFLQCARVSGLRTQHCMMKHCATCRIILIGTKHTVKLGDEH